MRHAKTAVIEKTILESGTELTVNALVHHGNAYIKRTLILPDRSEVTQFILIPSENDLKVFSEADPYFAALREVYEEIDESINRSDEA